MFPWGLRWFSPITFHPLGETAVYDTNFKRVELSENGFQAGHGGFVPFNIQNIGNNLHVTYAKQNKTKTFVDFGAGLGFLDLFSGPAA
jgi:hypothetical protein